MSINLIYANLILFSMIVPLLVVITLLSQFVRHNMSYSNNQYYAEFLTKYFGITYFKAKRYVSFHRRNRVKKVETFH